MTDYGLKKSHDPVQDAIFKAWDQGYALGLKHGIEKERQEWMKKIGDAVIDALREATAPEEL